VNGGVINGKQLKCLWLFQDAEWTTTMQLADKHKWNSNGKCTWIILSHRLYEELEIIPGKTQFRNRGEGNGA
jgi:hypothetical protein